MSCPDYRAPFQAQLKEPISGRYDCTAYSAATAIATSTCGAKVPTGRQVRLATNEPVPDSTSPGLNLRQVADAMSKPATTACHGAATSSADWRASRP